jgi:hypothetical protein
MPPAGSSPARTGGADVIRAEPFDAIEIDLNHWWLGDQPRLLEEHAPNN